VSRFLPAILVGVIVVCAWVIFSQIKSPTPVANPRYAALGEWAGTEAAELVSNGDLVLFLRHGGERPVLAAQCKAFEAALKKNVEVRVETSVLPEPPIEQMVDYAPDPGISDADFVRLTSSSEAPALVVSFMGLPVPGPRTKSHWRKHRPRLMVVGERRPAVEPAIQAGWLDLAVVFTEAVVKTKTTPREWAEAHYEILRKE